MLDQIHKIENSHAEVLDMRCLRLFKTDIPSAAAGILVVIMKQSLTHRTLYSIAYGVECVFHLKAHKLSGIMLFIPQRDLLPK